MPERLTRASRAAPAGARPPLGQDQHTFPPSVPTRSSRFPPRMCLRKGCGRIFHPGRWNQRYCQDPGCLRLVRRWQAAKRQRQRRDRPEVRQERAAAARQWRVRHREECRVPPETRAAPTAEGEETDAAWSRSKKNSSPFCDRPGCYEPPRPSCRCTSRYCTDECRRAMRRVCDRERKWLSRTTAAGRFKRALEYQARRAARADGATQNRGPLPSGGIRAVVDYRDPDKSFLSYRDIQELACDDRETPLSARPRAPPTS